MAENGSDEDVVKIGGVEVEEVLTLTTAQVDEIIEDIAEDYAEALDEINGTVKVSGKRAVIVIERGD